MPERDIIVREEAMPMTMRRIACVRERNVREIEMCVCSKYRGREKCVRSIEGARNVCEVESESERAREREKGKERERERESHRYC